MFIKRFLVTAFLTPSLDRQVSTLQWHFQFGSFEIEMIQLIPKNPCISSGFAANSLRFCVAYRFVWSICFFKFMVFPNIRNGLAFSGKSNNAFAYSIHFFPLTNLDGHFQFNSVTFFLGFLAGDSKTSPSIWTGVRS